MLIEFSVGNFLSFKEPTNFSMVASYHKEHIDTNVFQVNEKINLVKIGAVYGANASGKSNLFKAMAFVRNFIINSARNTMAEDQINVDSFKLSTETVTQPSSFEIIIIYNSVKYRYGFQLTPKEVVSEWFYYTPNIKEIKLFERKSDKIVIGKHFKEGSGLENKTRRNALFLSVVAQFNGEISNTVLKWFYNFNFISNLSDTIQTITTQLIETNKDIKKMLIKFLKVADLGIESLELVKREIPNEIKQTLSEITNSNKNLRFKFPEKVVDINVYHKKFDETGKVVSLEKFDLDLDESEGTKRLYSLLGPVIDTLFNGGILAVDEFDSSLHPLLTRFIIELFHSKQRNSKNAQLIFNTHDTNILSNEFFRRDQIWFTEKDRYGATDLYSLVEYRVRKDASFGKDYLMGKYGAIPFIGNFDFEWECVEEGAQNGE